MNRKAFILFGAGLLAFSIARAELPKTITTTDGETYQGVSLIRVEPDGYLVNYRPEGNGVGVAKIKFARLSRDLQRKGGYNAAEARDFESDVAEAQQAYAKLLSDWAAKAKALDDENNAQLVLSAERQREINEAATHKPAPTAPANQPGDYGSNPLRLATTYALATPDNTGKTSLSMFIQTPSIPTHK